MRLDRPSSVYENMIFIQEIINSCKADIQIVAVNQWYWGHFAGKEPGASVKYYHAYDHRSTYNDWVGPKGSIRHDGHLICGEIGSNLVRIEEITDMVGEQLSIFDLEVQV